MTKPSDSPEPPTENVPTSHPADPPAEGAPAAGTAQSAPPPVPPAQPFAPVLRAPRTPWVNPARRVHVVAVAVVGALIFGGAGILVGHAVTGHGAGHGVAGRVVRGPGGYRPGFGRGPQQYRDLPRQHGPNAPVLPKPVPPGSTTPPGSATS